MFNLGGRGGGCYNSLEAGTEVISIYLSIYLSGPRLRFSTKQFTINIRGDILLITFKSDKSQSNYAVSSY